MASNLARTCPLYQLIFNHCQSARWWKLCPCCKSWLKFSFWCHQYRSSTKEPHNNWPTKKHNWPSNSRFYYVSIDGISSMFFDILWAWFRVLSLALLWLLFFAPLFDLKFFFYFADDTFIHRIEQCRAKLIKNMEKISRNNHQVVAPFWTCNQSR